MKYCRILFFLIFASAIIGFAQTPRKYYRRNKKAIVEKQFVIHDNYVYVTGVARKISSDDMALEMAEADSLDQLTNLIKNSIDFSAAPVKLGDKLKSAVFNNFRLFNPFRYTAKKRITLGSYVRGRYAYYIAAYNLNDVTFEIKTPISWERIYNDFKNNPDKRNELVFYEIIPAKDMAALQGEIEAKLVRQCGKKFALMFMDKDVPPIEKAEYEAAKKSFAKYNSATPLQLLVIAANRLPYDAHICRLLAEKFAAMQMPRCAGVMKKCASQSSKLVVKLPPPPPPQPVNPVVDPVPAAPAVTPAVKAPAAPAVTPAVKLR